MRCINSDRDILDAFLSNKICPKLFSIFVSVYYLLKIKLGSLMSYKWQMGSGEHDQAKNRMLEQRQSPVSRLAKSFALVRKYQDFSE